MNTVQVIFYVSIFLAIGILFGYSLGYIDGESKKKGGL